jgi:SAM-dependent methyltransferase
MSTDFPLNAMRDSAEVAATVAAAAQAGIFEGLMAGPSSAPALAERLGLDARSLGIVLGALADWALVVSHDEVYELTDLGRRTLGDPSSPEYVARGLPLWLASLRAMTELPEVLRTGRGSGATPRALDREQIKHFMAGMAAAPAARVRHVVDLCLARAPHARTALDVGGGPGLYARELTSRGLEVTLFDMPDVIDFVADAYQLREATGIQLAAGDAVDGPLPAGPFDLVLVSNVLHIYGPEQNRALLRNVAEVTAPGGVIAVGEMVRGRSPRAARFAIVMLLNTEHGNTYTVDEYETWLREAGFGAVQVDEADAERQLITAKRTTAPAVA